MGGWRLLIDPTFDAPGRRYAFGWGTSSRKVTGPAVAASEIGSVDAVLLSHDHHADNLDDAGRALLPSAGTVVTTVSGARRLRDTADLGDCLGGVQFPETGPVRYSMTGRDAVEVCRLAQPHIVIPVHYEGWTHFKQGRDAIERDLADSPDDQRKRVHWLPLGSPVEFPG